MHSAKVHATEEHQTNTVRTGHFPKQTN